MSVAIAYAGAASDTSNASSYSVPNVPTGTAATDRYVFAALYWGGTSGITLSSATIGGVAALIVGQAVSADAGRNVAIISAPLPLGTSTTVTAVLSGTTNRLSIDSWAVTGTATNLFADIKTSALATVTSLSVTINTVNNGGAIGAICFTSSAGGNTAWTNLTEDSDTSVEIAAFDISGAHATTSVGTLAVTAAITSGTGSSLALIVVSIPPAPTAAAGAILSPFEGPF